MNVEYSRQFAKAAFRLSGKYKESLKRIVSEVKSAVTVSDINSCTKLVSFRDSYRIKMGDYRIIILLKICDNKAIFELLLSRGEIYNKGNSRFLRNKEKD